MLFKNNDGSNAIGRHLETLSDSVNLSFIVVSKCSTYYLPAFLFYFFLMKLIHYFLFSLSSSSFSNISFYSKTHGAYFLKCGFVCVSVCIYLHVYVYIFIYMHISTYISMSICVYVYVYVQSV